MGLTEKDEDVIDRLERKYFYKKLTVFLSEEEWDMLNQLGALTGLNKSMLFRLALNQLLRDILSKKQLEKKVGREKERTSLEKTPLQPSQEKKGTNHRKASACSVKMPENLIQAINDYAETNRLKTYEVYSRAVDEFLQETVSSSTRPDYLRCPEEARIRSIGIFLHTLQGLKALSKRDRIPAYHVVYTALVRFVEKNQLLPK